MSIIKIRIMVKNKVHALLDKNGFVSDHSDIFGNGGLQWLRSLGLPSVDILMLDNHLEHIENLNRQIERVNEEIRVKASQDEAGRTNEFAYSLDDRYIPQVLSSYGFREWAPRLVHQYSANNFCTTFTAKHRFSITSFVPFV